MNENAKLLAAQSSAAKLCRTRARRIKQIAALVESVRGLDTKIGTELLHCSPAARHIIRQACDNQDSALLGVMFPENLIAQLPTQKGVIAR